MTDFEEYRFVISSYTPTTMPLARLAEYLTELAKLLGETPYVHFDRLELGSTIAVQKIEREAVPRIHARTESIKRGEAPSDVMRAYKKMNIMLYDDNGTGVLTKGKGAEIIQFPGEKKEVPESLSIKQKGEIDGRVMRVGGMGEPVPILLEVEGVQLSGCSATRDIAKPLAACLFEPVRLFGDGYWNRTVKGAWELEKFNVNRFESLHGEALSSVVSALRNLQGDTWGSNGVTDILKLRHEEGDL